jgi:hypothetical protein
MCLTRTGVAIPLSLRAAAAGRTPPKSGTAPDAGVSCLPGAYGDRD